MPSSSITLGRGLESLIPKKANIKDLHIRSQIAGPQEQIEHVVPEEVTMNPHQPRRTFTHADMEELMNSIKEHGILQPLIVTRNESGYQLISGERRLRAARMLSLARVPVIVRQASEQEKLALALIENVQRRDLNPVERAWGYARLIEEFGLTQEQAAKKVGQSRASLANTLRILKLPEPIQRALADGKLTEGHAKVLLSVDDPAAQQRLFLNMLDTQLSVRAAETLARGSRAPRMRRRDPNLADTEDRLQQTLGTKVEIVRSGSKGTIRVHFYSAEELAELVRRLTPLS